MQDKETKTKTIRFDIKLLEKIEALAEEGNRDFSKQVQWMLKQYIEIIEKTKA